MHRFSCDHDLKFNAYDVLDWLHNNGWTLGHTAEDGVWLILGKIGSMLMRASGSTLEDACMNAVNQTRLAVEMN